MPIRLNLLAEHQAEEDLRRRDPVKRALWVGTVGIGLLLLWAAFLQARLLNNHRKVRSLDSQFVQIGTEYSLVATNVNRIAEARKKLDALQTLATNRFLWAPHLNALQYVMVDDVQVVRLKTDQTFKITEGTKAVTNAAGVKPGQPPTSTEKVLFLVEAKDFSEEPGNQIFPFQEAINTNAFLRPILLKTELTGRSPVQTDPNTSPKPFVQFTIECQYPERTR